MTVFISIFYLFLPYIYSVEVKIGLILNSDTEYVEAYSRIAQLSSDKAATLYPDIEITIKEKRFDDNLMISSGEAACELVEEGVVAIISTTDSTSTKTEAEILARLHIPMVSVSASDPFLHNPVGSDYILTMSPSDAEQSKAIFAIIKKYGWYEFSILASSDRYGINGVLGLLNLQYIVNTDDKYRINRAQYFHSEEKEILDHLKIIKDSLEHIIVLHCSADDAKVVLEKADTIGLLAAGYVWIVTDAIVGDVRVLSGPSSNDIFPSYLEGLIGTAPVHDQTTAAYKAFKDSYTGSFSDLTTCTLGTYDAVQIIAKAAEKYLTTEKQNLVQGVNCKTPSTFWQQGSNFYSNLVNIEHSGISKEIRFTEEGKIQNNTYDIVNFVNNGFQKVGKWDSDGITGMGDKVMFLGSKDVVPPAFINKLSGQVIKMGIVEEPPLAFKNKSEECKNNYHLPECWYGFCPEINRKLAVDLNFTIKYVEPKDNKYGGRDNATGNWNGMIKDILDGRTDMTGTALAINVERSKAIAFSFPFTEDSAKSIVKGSMSTHNPFFFLNAFNIKVWLLIIGIIFFLTVVMNFLNKMSPYGLYGNKMYALQTCSCDVCRHQRIMKAQNINHSLQEQHFECKVEEVQHEEYMDQLSLYNSLWTIAAGFVCQGGESFPKCASARFLLWAWWFFVMITISMYTANITAFLTLKRVGVSINSIKQLPGQTQYQWGVISDRNIESRLLNHVDKEYKTVVEGGNRITGLEDAIKLVKEGDFVFIDEGSVIDYNFRDECDFITIETPIESNEWAYGISTYSPYLNIINQKFLQYKEIETFNELKVKWYKLDKECKSSQVGSDTPFDLSTLAGLFYLMAISVGVSLILLVAENIYAAYRDSESSTKIKLSGWGALKKRLSYKAEDIRTEWSCRCSPGKHAPSAASKANETAFSVHPGTKDALAV